MTNTTLTESQRFLQVFVDEQGKFKWEPEYRDRGELKTVIAIGDLAILVCAELNAFDEPIIEYVSREKGIIQGRKLPKFDVVIESIEPQALVLNKQCDGFVLPLPPVDGLVVAIDDEWKYRQYLVPDSQDDETTVNRWGYDGEEPGRPAHWSSDRTPVSAEDAETIRKLAGGLLSATNLPA